MGLKATRNCLLGLIFFEAFCFGGFVGAIGFGSRSVHVADSSPMLLPGWVMGWTLTLFCFVDSVTIRKPIPTFSQWVFFLSSEISMPAYLIWSRGWKGFLWVIVIAVCLVCIFAVGIGGGLALERLAS
jgi:hypothetical protein